MRPKSELSREDWGVLILGLTLVLGLILRIFPGVMAGFPINDGGMFFVMARDLSANGFRIPAYTSYNNFEIPFAYPPLGFYVAALLGSLGIPELAIVHWIPILISCSAIIVFYLLAKAVLKDGPRAAVATMIFALLPGNYEMQIMGGGLTRSFGVFFYILAIYAVYQLFEKDTWKQLIVAGLFCSLAVLSHPEVVLATASGCALCWAFYGRTWGKTFHAFLVACATVVLTAPWWGSVLAYHGLAPFLSALHTGNYSSFPLTSFYQDFLAPGSLFTLIGLLRIGGILWSLWRRQFFLVAWMVLPYLIEPRSAYGIASFPSAMLIALCLTDLLPAIVERILRRWKPAAVAQDFTRLPWWNLTVLLIVIYFFFQGVVDGFSLANTTLKPPAPLILMDWVKRNTPASSQFLILTGNSGVATDPIQEWFPVFTERRSQTTSQGLEWTLGTGFFTRVNQLIAVQKCGDIACIENWSTQTGLGYTEVLIDKSSLSKGLQDSFLTDKQYVLIYDSSRYSIFRFSYTQ